MAAASFFSTNNGTSWTEGNSGLTNTFVMAIAVSGTNLFAGTDGGVFLSTNNGTNWTAVNSGLINPYIYAFVVSGTNLFAGTLGSGVFRRPLSEMITSVPAEGGLAELPTHFSLEQNYPNPFNPSTTIMYRLPSQAHITLKVFNVLGHEVATLVNEVKQPGMHTVLWEAAIFPSGVYFCRLQAGLFTKSERLVFLR